MRHVPIYQVDAFARGPFTGNPAAVCLLADEHLPLSDSLRQQIAAENNLAETAFVECAAPGDHFSSAAAFRLRWFTPSVEVPLCGHATLAAAAVLFGELGNPSPELTFETLSGPLTVANTSTAASTALNLTMSLPHMPPRDPLPRACTGANADLVKALCPGLQVADVCFAAPLKYLLVVLAAGTTRQQLEQLKPELAVAEKCSSDGEITGAIVALQGDGERDDDILSRFFAPWAGIPEDPVTGSAHAVLGPYFSKRLGRAQLTAQQCSARSGRLKLEVQAGPGRVLVSGDAVTMLKGTFYVPPEESV